MKQTLALRILGEVMKWDSSRCRDEFGWLSLMSRLKYDGYRGFTAGARFLESLAYWLQQFRSEEREAAYSFVRDRLLYFGPQEVQHLVELFFPEVVQRRLIRKLAEDLGVPAYRVWSHQDAESAFKRLVRRTLFMGLSDGARIDAFRRANEGILSNEQVVVATEINDKKWESLRKKLRADVNDPEARFAFIYLLDDFTGSGTTLLRHEDEGWDGKLHKFWTQTRNEVEATFQSDVVLGVHHYVASAQARESNGRRQEEAKAAIGAPWFQRVEFTYGIVLPESVLVTPESARAFCDLVERYYDPVIESESIKKGGTNAKFGFATSRLPLVLEHNTPNNSVALLWAETAGEDGRPAMRPLFRRRQRHS